MTESRQCSAHDCDELAVCSYEWPGQGEIFQCGQHAFKAVHVACALGFALTLRTLDGKPLTAFASVPSVPGVPSVPSVPEDV